jgi:hypothetical protein
MEYKQGLDRVGDSTSFPFPIKLEYDSENIYLTPLWIPETSDILVAKDKITKQPINLLDANELGNLWLCIEVKDGYYMPIKRDPKNNYYYRRKNHPTRGGKYHLKYGFYGGEEEINYLDNAIQNHIEMNNTYTFPYRKIDFSNHGGERSLRRYAKGEVVGTAVVHNEWFVYVRGTYRYGHYKYNDLKRTGIYSNIAKLEFDLDLDN